MVKLPVAVLYLSELLCSEAEKSNVELKGGAISGAAAGNSVIGSGRG